MLTSLVIKCNKISNLSKFAKNKLLQQSGLYLLGQSLQKACSLLLIPIWTAYLTPSDYGITGTLGAYANILHILLMFGIYGAVVRYYFELQYDIEAQATYVTSNFFFLLIVPGAVLGSLMLFGQSLWAWASSDAIPFQPYVVLMLITAYGGLLYALPYSLFQAQQKAHKCVALDFVGFLITVSLSLFFVVGYHQGAFGMMLGGAVSQTILALVATGLLLKEWFRPRFAWTHIASSLKFGLPLVPHLLSGWALTFADRVMLERMVSLEEVGRYTLGYNIGMIMNLVVTSINQAYQPYYFSLMKSAADVEQKIVRFVCLYFTGIGFITLLGSLFAGEIVSLATPPRFHLSAVYIPPILLGYMTVGLYFIVASPLFYYKKTFYLPFISGIAAIFNVCLNLLLIPKFGPIAAAWSTFACYAFIAGLYYILAQKVSPLPYPVRRIVLVILLILGAVLFTGNLPLFAPATYAIKLLFIGVYLVVVYFLIVRFSLLTKPQIVH